MTRPNAALCLPFDERPPALQAASSPEQIPSSNILAPGLQLEIDRLGSMLDEAVMMWARRSESENLAALAASLTQLESLIAHARKTVMRLRALKCQPSQE